MGKIFYIMGKSASGKDRIYSLLAAHKELKLKTLILYTTRPQMMVRGTLQIPIIWESVLWSHLKRCVNTMGKMQSVLFMSR